MTSPPSSTPSATYTPSVQLPVEALQLLNSARVAHTPCGDGSTIWHIWGESGSRPDLAPLVLFHGGSGSWTHWIRNIQALVTSGRRVYVPDLPGFGDSARPPQGGDADAMVAPLADGLRQLLSGDRCDLVGFSFGGLTAGLLAVQHPDLIARLVLVGAPGLAIAAIDAVRLHTWAHLPDEKDRDAAHRHNLESLMFHKPESITPLAMGVHKANVVRDRLKGRRLARTDILLRSLPDMDFPVFAVYGREDVLYLGQLPALEAALRQAPQFRGLQFVEDAGHWVQFEQAQAFDAALLAALDAPIG